MAVSRPAAFALALAALPALRAEEPQRKMTSFPADLTPAFEELENRGITELEGLRAAYGNIEAMFRPVPSEAAAQLVPYGFDNIHVPWSMRGLPVPRARRRPGVQWGARYIDMDQGVGNRFINAGIVVHEIAHGEFAYWNHRTRSDARIQKQHELVDGLARRLREEHGLRTWTQLRADEMAAYYIETSVQEVAQRIESVFLVNRFNVNRVIHSRADREALVDADGREILLASREDSSLRNLWDKPAWLVGGRKGDAWFNGDPIEAEIPEDWRHDFYQNILGLGLPETGDEVVEIARTMDTPWSREQRRMITQMRDSRVERLEAADESSPVPGMAGLERSGRTGLVRVQPSEAELALLARIAAGLPFPPVPSRLRHGGGPPMPAAPEDAEEE